MKAGDKTRVPISSLEKDPGLLEVIARLQDVWGEAAFDIVDHWEGDLCAVGVAKPADHGVLAYIGNFGKKEGRYYLELESPPQPGSTTPYTSQGVYQDVSFERLTALVGRHLGLNCS